ncbi:MAG: hypothetical protein IKO00_02215 [Oscillospiraceae bacterium]|nr:hypothetical protein [Oscillospiraceae bacterium]
MTEQEKRESVIKEFKDNYRPYSPGYAHALVRNWAVRDAIDLLKLQEPKPPVIKENSYGWKFYYCPSCGKEFYQNNKFSFCEKCGQAVSWK